MDSNATGHEAPPRHTAEAHGSTSHDHHDDHGHKQSFISKYVFSSDHKVIGLQYGFSSLVFLFLGFLLMAVMRWPIAYGPDKPLPIIGAVVKAYAAAHPDDPKTPLNESVHPIVGHFIGTNGSINSEVYNTFGAMHGTIMVFLAVVPLGFAAFGNYLVPLMIGAPDMAFPRLNMWSFWVQFTGGVTFFCSFFLPGGAAKSGWTSYTPLSVIADSGPQYHVFFNGQTMWLVGLVFLITASLLGAVNFITTVIQLRAPGMTWMKLPYMVWAMFVTAFLLLLAFPPLEAAGIMQLMDRVAHTSFFVPSGLYVDGLKTFETHAGGGSSLLYQHLFWFLGHPEVYVLLLPAIGIVCEVIACNTRKPIFGYKSMVFGTLALGFLSFIVWAHHMYLTGMGTKVSAFFQTTTMLISIPSVILLTCLMLSLYGASIRFNTPMLFCVAFLPMFGLGGLTGLPLAFNATDLVLHDTYYVIAHFHYIVAPGIIFGLFAGIYHWYPKFTGRMMSEFWGKVHFWPSFILMNVIFLPMFVQGMAGMHRRMFDGGATYAETLAPVLKLNELSSWGAWLLGVAQIPFILNFFLAMWIGRKAGSDNPWQATTLEWQTPTPPPHGNFDKPVKVYNGPYEYSVPGHPTDFIPQNEKPSAEAVKIMAEFAKTAH